MATWKRQRGQQGKAAARLRQAVRAAKPFARIHVAVRRSHGLQLPWRNLSPVRGSSTSRVRNFLTSYRERGRWPPSRLFCRAAHEVAHRPAQHPPLSCRSTLATFRGGPFPTNRLRGFHPGFAGRHSGAGVRRRAWRCDPSLCPPPLERAQQIDRRTNRTGGVVPGDELAGATGHC